MVLLGDLGLESDDPAFFTRAGDPSVPLRFATWSPEGDRFLSVFADVNGEEAQRTLHMHDGDTGDRLPEESIVSTIRIQGESGVAFRGNVATRLPPGAADTLRVMAGSTTPETFSSVEQQAFPMKRFIVGRDRIRVKVRPDIK